MRPDDEIRPSASTGAERTDGEKVIDSVPTTNTTIVDKHEPSWWLRSRIDNLPERWSTAGVRACGHLPGPVGITALHRPDLLTCIDCADRFKLDGPEDFECDRCGRYCDQPTGIVYDTRLGTMRLIVMFGLCPSCEQREMAA